MTGPDQYSLHLYAERERLLTELRKASEQIAALERENIKHEVRAEVEAQAAQTPSQRAQAEVRTDLARLSAAAAHGGADREWQRVAEQRTEQLAEIIRAKLELASAVAK